MITCCLLATAKVKCNEYAFKLNTIAAINIAENIVVDSIMVMIFLGCAIVSYC